MKTTMLCFLLSTFTTANAISADLQIAMGFTQTIEVDDCAKNEVGQVVLVDIPTGGQGVEGRCLPAICTYRNETDWPFSLAGTKWTIEIKGQTQAGGMFSYELFDRAPGMIKVLNVGVGSKEERDELLEKYQSDGICQGSYYDRTVSNI
ncbi:MAG: hypothetical protein AAB425_16010 [Bdellovibrionota bacterium]